MEVVIQRGRGAEHSWEFRRLGRNCGGHWAEVKWTKGPLGKRSEGLCGKVRGESREACGGGLLSYFLLFC